MLRSVRGGARYKSPRRAHFGIKTGLFKWKFGLLDESGARSGSYPIAVAIGISPSMFQNTRLA